MFSNFLTQQGFFISLVMFAIGAVGSLALYRKDHPANLWANGFAIAGSFIGILFSVSILFSGKTVIFEMLNTFSLFPVFIKVDMLSAFFVLIISTVSFLSTIYAIGYMRQFYGKYNLGSFGFFYNIFIASMMLVVTANNSLYFILVWELMSLASYFLVIFEFDHRKNIKAGFLYFIMTHIATGGILLGFLLLYAATGSFDFEVIRSQSGNISPSMFAMVSILMLAGFGTKAGIIPLHIWLPEAHPAAPSQVSALMSGVMIKTGIFMIIRIFFDIIPGAPIWLGLLILFLGAISSILGVLYALSEHDVKRLLAYHSVENIGIILMGIGSALVFISYDHKSLAALALLAALYHTMNHAIFKALLFLAAGSVVMATHTRNIEEYGGLIKRMPQTALFFLVGAVAISALPPFNGFISEWLTFQSLFAGVGSFDIFTKGIFIFAIVSLSFTGGLAAACFVKAFGITFLAKPRSKESEEAEESELSLRFGMAVLAAFCLLLGIFANFVVSFLANVIDKLPIFSSNASDVFIQNNAIQIRGDFASLSILQIFAVLAFFSFLVFYIFNYITRAQKEKIYGTWDCGATLNPRMEITATSFSRSIISIFKGVLKPTKQIDVEYRDANIRYFTKSSTVVLGMSNVYKVYLYDPLTAVITRISNIAKRIQCGNINLYILYIFITVIVLLIWITQ